MMRAAMLRGTCFLALWFVLDGASLAGLPLGLAAAALAAWTSLVLSPPAATTARPVALARLVLHLPVQAIAAGARVARAALDPRFAVQPGSVTCQPALPPGRARDAFLAYASLLPSTLPSGTTMEGAVIVHTLDMTEPVADGMTSEETRFARAFGCDA
jgi:multicomponent Na+:H+ antiporter subunit E